MTSEQLSGFMALAIRLAEKPVFSPHPNPRVGCVLVKNDKIIGQGFHLQAGLPHAEINALNNARENNESVVDTIAFLTLEPCSHFGRTPPCADALIESGIRHVYIAMQDPNPKVAGQGIEKLRQAGINVDCGLLEAEARKLNKGFIKRMQQGLPWVRSKIAISLDGRTAMQSGESQWITGPAARQDVQRLRARADVILTGSGTIKTDDPQLNVRDLDVPQELMRQPLRVIVDSQLRTPANARIFRTTGNTLLATLKSQKEKSHHNAKNVIEIAAADNEKIDLLLLLRALANREINEVHVEAGSGLNGALLSNGLIDELVVYMATDIMGDAAQGMFHLPQLQKMQDKIHFTCHDVRQVGNDIRFQLYSRTIN